jgi:hypothetical protein
VLSYHPRHSIMCEVSAGYTVLCSASEPQHNEHTSACAGGFLGEKHDRRCGWVNNTENRYMKKRDSAALSAIEELPSRITCTILMFCG